MKKTVIFVVIAVALIAGLIVAYVVMRGEREREAAREKPVAPPSRVKRTATGEYVVTLDAETQKRIALRIESLAAATLGPEVKAYGRVLDPATLTAALAELVAAETTLKTSQQSLEHARLSGEGELTSALAAAKSSAAELERLKTLFQQGNASARSVQAAETAAQRDQSAAQTARSSLARAMQSAEAALERDRVAFESARARLASSWGPALMGRKDLPTLLRSLNDREAALVRVDLPAGEPLSSPPESARVIPLTDESRSANASLLGPAANVDAQTQGQGFFLLVKNPVAALQPNAAVTALLKLLGAQLNGVVVPRDAVLRSEGRAWAYVQAGADGFTRREVSLDRPTERGWFVISGFNGGDRVVVAGAQQLLSEELKSQIKMAD